jgi:hypothetical protein
MEAFARKFLPTAVLITMWLAPQSSRADAPQLLPVLKELQAQQAQITDNQTKIDTKIADLAETVRIARIYASRLGGAHKPPKVPKK